jgi:hypothetical protein
MSKASSSGEWLPDPHRSVWRSRSCAERIENGLVYGIPVLVRKSAVLKFGFQTRLTLFIGLFWVKIHSGLDGPT